MGDNTTVGYTRGIVANDVTNNNAINPSGWDILTQVYDGYLVHMTKIKCVFQNTSSVPCKCVIAIVDVDSSLAATSATNAISATDFNDLCQSTNAVVGYLSPSGGGKDTLELESVIKMSKYSGNGKNKLTPANELFCGNTGNPDSTKAFSQPAKLYYWVVGVATSSGANLGSNAVYMSNERCQYT